jgi:hypothetical protein
MEYKTRICEEDLGIERKCAGNGTCPVESMLAKRALEIADAPFG